MITQDELENFVHENTPEVVARNWYIDLERASRAEALLYGFTPGGSEYVDDPHRCALHIKERLSGVVEQVKRRKQAEEENKKLRQINDILDAKLDSSIIVNCQALACSAPVAAEMKRLEQYAVRTLLAEAACQSAQVEIDRLRNMLNTDSQLFQIECLKAEVELLRAQLQEAHTEYRDSEDYARISVEPDDFLKEIRKRAAHKYPRFGISVEG